VLFFPRAISATEGIDAWASGIGRSLSSHFLRENAKQILVSSCNGDSTVRVWNLQTGECERELEGHYRQWTVMSVSITPDGRRAVSGG
jgi:WD40 repeat protein